MTDRRVCIGIITSPHGVRGMVRIKPFTEQPDGVGAYGPVTLDDGRRFEISVRSLNKGMALAVLDGISNREDADLLRGMRLYIDRARLPEAEEGSIYQADLIGCQVTDPVLGTIGTVTAVFDYGAGAMLEIRRPKGEPGDAQGGGLVLVPFGGHHPLELEGKTITLTVDPAWLED